jgi:hypothetical protein
MSYISKLSKHCMASFKVGYQKSMNLVGRETPSSVMFLTYVALKETCYEFWRKAGEIV